MTINTRELATLLVKSLGLEDIDPEQVDLSVPLFGDGLGLDSLDMLEIALVIQQHFGVKIKAGDSDVEKIFGSLNSLAEYLDSAITAQA